MKKENIPGWLLLMLVVGYLPTVQAADCSRFRGSVGVEGISSSAQKTLWDLNGKGFRKNTLANAYAMAELNCQITEKVSGKLYGLTQYASASHQPGLMEGKKNSGIGILKESYLSYDPGNGIFIDVGKIRRNNGYLFSVNPLDLLRNTSANPRAAKINVQGSRWRDVYEEGSYGIAATYYGEGGTYDAAVLPRLTRHNRLQQSAADWSEFQRTNDKDRYYLSYTSTGVDKFNPTVSLVAGSYKALALGGSMSLTDRLILSLESSLARGQRWRHLDMDKARNILDLETERQPYKQDKDKVNADLGISLRYTDDQRREYGMEYYGQTQGYSRREWQTYFDMAEHVNGGYIQKIRAADPARLTPDVAAGYKQYSLLMSTELDNASRAGNRLGKHYVTLYVNSKKDELRKIDWTASALVNLVDTSSVLNLHLNTHVTQHLEVYTGASYSLGSERTEFGQFGEKGTYYVGTRFIW